jgi:hypothetical protein
VNRGRCSKKDNISQQQDNNLLAIDCHPLTGEEILDWRWSQSMKVISASKNDNRDMDGPIDEDNFVFSVMRVKRSLADALGHKIARP